MLSYKFKPQFVGLNLQWNMYSTTYTGQFLLPKHLLHYSNHVMHTKPEASKLFFIYTKVCQPSVCSRPIQLKHEAEAELAVAYIFRSPCSNMYLKYSSTCIIKTGGFKLYLASLISSTYLNLDLICFGSTYVQRVHLLINQSH